MPDPMQPIIDRILDAETFAVVGASRSPEKYGHMVYVMLKEAGKQVYPINPTAGEIDGAPCYSSLGKLPIVPAVAVFVVPPAATTLGLEECAELGICDVWLQEGSEPDDVEDLTETLGLNAVYGGPCIMVALKTAAYRTRA